MLRLARKLLSYMLLFVMFFSVYPTGVFGETEASQTKGTVVSSSGEDIPLMLEPDESSELLSSIPNGTSVGLVKFEHEYWFVTYENPDNGEDLLGFIHESYVSIQDTSSAESQVEENEDGAIAEEENHPEEKNESTQAGTGVKEAAEEVNEDLQRNDETGTEASTQVTLQSKSAAILQNLSSAAVSGVALKSPTHVYSSNDAESAILKSYPQGTLLKYHPSDSDWYQCTVYVNGKAKTGFINKNDVEEPADPQTDLRGAVKNSKLNVHSKASSSSSILKSYTEGSILKFQTYITGWYQATVYVGGKAATGYIKKDDVILSVLPQTEKKGIVKTSRLNVYSKAISTSSVLKSYSEGSSIKFKTFTDEWYEATVYVNGKPVVGYIHRSSVVLEGTPQVNLTGIVKPVSLNVYAKTSGASQVLKRYTEGSVLRFRTFTDNWYEATVYVSGEPHTGYIKKSEVLDPDDPQKELSGIVKVLSLNVYSSTSRSSGVLKSYEQGRVLKYRTYTANWYQATVYVNGKAVTGYIHKQDIENTVSSQVSLTGTAQDPSGVRVYTRASATSDVLKSYPKGSTLKYKTFTSEWHQVTVYINNKPVTGYIKKTSLEKGLKGKIIVVDAGHGGVDNGAKGVEKLLNLKTAIQLESLLKATGAKVVMSRTAGVYLTLSERVEVSHQYNADAFVSIHYNSNPNPSPHGIETYYWASNVNELLMAKYVQQEIIMQTGLYDRGVKTGDFHVIRENKNAAILVELGFLSNPAELETVLTSAYQKKAATGIYKGLEKYFNL